MTGTIYGSAMLIFLFTVSVHASLPPFNQESAMSGAYEPNIVYETIPDEEQYLPGEDEDESGWNGKVEIVSKIGSELTAARMKRGARGKRRNIREVTRGPCRNTSGKSSYYAHDFHRKKTATGEKFNMYAMTAASRAICFDCLVRVINLDNGLSVTVRINDNGPFSENPEHIIDLSLGAAMQIGIIDKNGRDKGVAKVQLICI